MLNVMQRIYAYEICMYAQMPCLNFTCDVCNVKMANVQSETLIMTRKSSILILGLGSPLEQ